MVRRLEEFPERCFVLGFADGDRMLGSAMTTSKDPLEELLRLSHEIGREDRKLTILGEGNTSAQVNGKEFLVKASGSCLTDLRGDQVTRCRFDTVLTLLEERDRAFTNEEVDEVLEEASEKCEWGQFGEKDAGSCTSSQCPGGFVVQ